MSKTRKLEPLLAALLFTLTTATTPVTFADCPASFITVPSEQWNSFVDGFKPRIVAEQKNNVLVGIRIFWVHFGTLTALGLRNGDRIVAINAHPVGGTLATHDPEAFIARHLDEARSRCELSVTVERRGTRRALRASCERASDH